MVKGRGKVYTNLLEDENLKRWYNNTARGSVITADVYLRRLGKFCEDYRVTPQKIIELNEKEIYDLLLDAVSDLEEKGKAGKYIAHLVTTVKSWLEHNGKTITRKIKVTGTNKTPTLSRERTPTQPELKKIFMAATLQQRVACTLLAHSGLRIQVLGSYQGKEGLKVGDIPELRIEEKIEFEKMPAQIVVRSSLSKAGHQYLTFLSEEGCGYLRDYLEERKRKSEKLSQDSPILSPKTVKKNFISSTNVSDLIRTALRKAGYGWRPYVLRSYFDTQLMLAESKGCCIRDYRTFWMGHKGDIEHTYTTNKGKLSPDVIEDMRSSYKRSQELLQTETATPKEMEIKNLFKKELLKVSGFTDEEAEEFMAKNPPDEEFNRAIRERLSGRLANGDCLKKQKVVSLAELGQYLERGWEFVTQLPENKVIIYFSESS